MKKLELTEKLKDNLILVAKLTPTCKISGFVLLSSRISYIDGVLVVIFEPYNYDTVSKNIQMKRDAFREILKQVAEEENLQTYGFEEDVRRCYAFKIIDNEDEILDMIKIYQKLILLFEQKIKVMAKTVPNRLKQYFLGDYNSLKPEPHNLIDTNLEGSDACLPKELDQMFFGTYEEQKESKHLHTCYSPNVS